MILVTGATGTVGRHVVPLLLGAGQRVRVLVRDPAKVEHLAGEVEVAQGDLDEPTSLPPALAGVRSLFLVAEAGQVAGVLDAAGPAGVEHVVRLSTIEAGARPPIGPGRWHREAELLIEASGIGWTHLRPTMMMSNTLWWWADSIAGQRAVFFPGGDGRVCAVDPRDVAQVAAVVLTESGHDGRAYDVTGPQPLTVGEMVATLARVLDAPIRYEDVPETAAGEWMIRAGASPVLADALVETLRGIRANRYAGVADTVRRLTGQPGRGFEDWCRDNAEAFRRTRTRRPG